MSKGNKIVNRFICYNDKCKSDICMDYVVLSIDYYYSRRIEEYLFTGYSIICPACKTQHVLRKKESLDLYNVPYRKYDKDLHLVQDLDFEKKFINVICRKESHFSVDVSIIRENFRKTYITI